MPRTIHLAAGTAALLLGVVAGCSDASEVVAERSASSGVLAAASTQSADAVADAAPQTGTLPRVVVHKSPTCGCCNAWIDHLETYGFTVERRDHRDMGQIKASLGVPPGYGSCHTAEVDGYVIEGHVPAEDIHKLLTERPALNGLAVPGMPIGSPGMEQGGRVQAYEVYGFDDTGISSYARHGDG